MENAGDNRITRDSLEHGIHVGIAQSIRSCLLDKNGNSIDITAYGYLLGFFSYYFRCNIIHASKPVPLFSYVSEYELRCLRIINDLLEDFLDANLHKFFLESYADGSLITELTAVINNPTIKMG